jgi:hypothetical protein
MWGQIIKEMSWPEWVSEPGGADLRSMRVPAEHRVEEAALYATKWIEYRALHPAAATCLFAHAYHTQVRAFIMRCRDAPSAIRTEHSGDPFDSPTLTAMWLARQCADRVGTPYDVAMSFAEGRAVSRTHFRFPQPNQLYGEEFELDLAEHWKERLSSFMHYSRVPAVVADPEHAQFVIDMVRARSDAAWPGILGRMMHEGVLTEPRVRQEFGDTVFRLADVKRRMLQASQVSQC